MDQGARRRVSDAAEMLDDLVANVNNEVDPEFLLASKGEIGFVVAVMASIVLERIRHHHEDHWLDEATAPEG